MREQAGYGSIVAMGETTVARIDDAGVWIYHGYHIVGPYKREDGYLDNPFMYGMKERICPTAKETI
jgi:hypothetical protein